MFSYQLNQMDICSFLCFIYWSIRPRILIWFIANKVVTCKEFGLALVHDINIGENEKQKWKTKIPIQM